MQEQSTSQKWQVNSNIPETPQLLIFESSIFPVCLHPMYLKLFLAQTSLCTVCKPMLVFMSLPCLASCLLRSTTSLQLPEEQFHHFMVTFFSPLLLVITSSCMEPLHPFAFPVEYIVFTFIFYKKESPSTHQTFRKHLMYYYLLVV